MHRISGAHLYDFGVLKGMHREKRTNFIFSAKTENMAPDGLNWIVGMVIHIATDD